MKKRMASGIFKGHSALREKTDIKVSLLRQRHRADKMAVERRSTRHGHRGIGVVHRGRSLHANISRTRSLRVVICARTSEGRVMVDREVTQHGRRSAHSAHAQRWHQRISTERLK